MAERFFRDLTTQQLRRGAFTSVPELVDTINAYIAQKVLTMFTNLAPSRSVTADYHLTPREKEILQLLVDGLTMRQAAERLDVSYHTVDNHIRNIYEKLHVHSRSGAVAKALKERLL